jgi:hypothetical protein
LSERRFTGIFHGGRKFLHFKIGDPFFGLKKNIIIFTLEKDQSVFRGDTPQNTAWPQDWTFSCTIFFEKLELEVIKKKKK